MAIQLINVGQIANDGTGDDLREAMIKVNQNFEELDLRDDERTTATNLGAGEGLFVQRLNYDLQFKSLIAGDKITIASDNETITITGKTQALNFVSDSGSVRISDEQDFEIVGGDGISTAIVNDTLTITNNYWASLVEDTTPQLGGTLDAQGYPILGAGRITATDLIVDSVAASSFTGNLIGNVTGDVTGTVSDLGNHDTDDLDEGVNNLYFTEERVDDRVAALIAAGSNITVTYDDILGQLLISADDDLVNNSTDELAEGSTNLYYTDQRVQDFVDSYVRAGTGVIVSNGIISLPQEVDTDDTPTFAGVLTDSVTPPSGIFTISGNLVVTGTTTTVNTETLEVADNIIELNSNLTSGNIPTENAGIEVNRGSSANARFIWDENNDRWSSENNPIHAGGGFVGNLTGLVNGLDVKDLGDGFDLGSLDSTITTLSQWLLNELSLDVDMGTITSPDSATLDFGTLA